MKNAEVVGVFMTPKSQVENPLKEIAQPRVSY
jgi:hypothetical protein